MPLFADTATVVPLRTPLPGFTAMLSVTVTPETPLPLASSTCTLIAGVICEFGDVLLGCTTKTNVSAAFTVMLNCFVVVCCGVLESAACTVKLNVPIAVGVPLITPAELRVNPPGNGPEPEASDQVIVPIPPVAASCVLYATPSLAAGRVAVVIASFAPMRME